MRDPVLPRAARPTAAIFSYSPRAKFEAVPGLRGIRVWRSRLGVVTTMQIKIAVRFGLQTWVRAVRFAVRAVRCGSVRRGSVSAVRFGSTGSL